MRLLSARSGVRIPPSTPFLRISPYIRAFFLSIDSFENLFENLKKSGKNNCENNTLNVAMRPIIVATINYTNSIMMRLKKCLKYVRIGKSFASWFHA